MAEEQTPQEQPKKYYKVVRRMREDGRRCSPLVTPAHRVYFEPGVPAQAKEGKIFVYTHLEKAKGRLYTLRSRNYDKDFELWDMEVEGEHPNPQWIADLDVPEEWEQYWKRYDEWEKGESGRDVLWREYDSMIPRQTEIVDRVTLKTLIADTLERVSVVPASAK